MIIIFNNNNNFLGILNPFNMASVMWEYNVITTVLFALNFLLHSLGSDLLHVNCW